MELVWFDRQGRRREVIGPPGGYSSPWLSPDEGWVAVARVDPQTATRDLWLVERAGRRESRFTFDPSDDSQPLWSPDGRFIGFRSNRGGHGNFFRKVATGAGNEEEFFLSDTGAFPTDWSGDGEHIVFESPGAKTGWDLWVLGTADRRAVPFLRTRFNEMHGRLSPDGRWMAYSSDELGRLEIYVESFPRSGGKWQISAAGGSEPHWRGDGKELFYLAADRTLMAVPVATGERLEAGSPTPLFQARPATITAPFESNYAVSVDGQRFLVNTIVEAATSPPVTVVVNWTAQLEP